MRHALDAMGCFRNVGVLIDVSSGPDATPEGLEVSLHANANFTQVISSVLVVASDHNFIFFMIFWLSDILV